MNLKFKGLSTNLIGHKFNCCICFTEMMGCFDGGMELSDLIVVYDLIRQMFNMMGVEV